MTRFMDKNETEWKEGDTGTSTVDTGFGVASVRLSVVNLVGTNKLFALIEDTGDNSKRLYNIDILNSITFKKEENNNA